MYQTTEQQNPDNVKEIENKNELTDYLDQNFKFKAKCIGFKYNPKSMNYQITLHDLRPISEEKLEQLKLDYQVSLFSKPAKVADIGTDYDIEFTGQVIPYYTRKKVDGNDVKVKSYGLRLLDLIDFNYPLKGEYNGDNKDEIC